MFIWSAEFSLGARREVDDLRAASYGGHCFLILRWLKGLHTLCCLVTSMASPSSGVGAHTLSKFAVAGRVGDLFRAHADSFLGSEPSVSITTFQRDLYRHLAALLPHLGAIGSPRLCALLASGRARRDECFDGAVVSRATKGSGKAPKLAYTLHDVVGLLWDTVAMQIDYHIRASAGKRQRLRTNNTVFARNVWPQSDSEFSHAGRILLESCGRDVDDYLQPTCVEDCAREINTLCAVAFHGDLDVSMVRDHIAPVCSLELEPSKFLSHIIARSSIMCELIGEVLSQRLLHYMHRALFGMDVCQDAASVMDKMARELVRTRTELNTIKHAVATSDQAMLSVFAESSCIAVDNARPTCSRAQFGSGRGHARIDLRVSTLEYALKLNIAFKNVPSSIAESQGIFDLATKGLPIAPTAALDAMDKLLSTTTTKSDVSIIDSAVDLLTQDRVAKDVYF